MNDRWVDPVDDFGGIGRRSYLRAVMPSDYPELMDLESSTLLAPVRHRGTAPDPLTYGESLWHGVVAQALVVAPFSDHEHVTIGVVSLFAYDERNGNAQLGLLGRPRQPDGSAVYTVSLFEGCCRFVSFAFDNWPLRKVYGHMSAPAYARVRSGLGRYFTVEAVLRDHQRDGDGLSDLYVVAITAQGWDSHGRPALARASRGRRRSGVGQPRQVRPLEEFGNKGPYPAI